ncbi:hypothetical protein NLX83_08215 [Allokutzneria sp. A3M-2-11 16]|uniref:hypothetical protein n=1 Tax=Allokutzneria sp. A3M-2-11 16 TaxID=2962043 RepID=UPI0020B68011|nr:hypothetical protein [Allokutzneria sp. A3M-2-11 16]MCP3799239.1 hypothetical protein [Allokutzneria sp. A3M-2-11 16]
MDEHKLADLFRDAVREAPPASFDEQDVLGASKLATSRHRMRVATGSAFGVVVLAGVAVFGANALNLGADQGGVTAAQTSSEYGATEDGVPLVPFTGTQPMPSGVVPPGKTTQLPPRSIPEPTSKQGDGGSGSAGPRTSSTPTGCGPADRELAVALAHELPAAAGHTPTPANRSCAPGSKAVSVLVRDGDVSGVISVILAPPDVKIGTEDVGTRDLPPGSKSASAYAPSGRPLTVVSEPGQGSTSSPFGGRVEELAKKIAEKY